MRIGILGMGGVGSFIGAKLTKNFENDDDTKIVFICRGETKDSILRNGLTLFTGNNTINSRPGLVSDNPKEIGVLDILLIATKAFSLASAVKQYQECFHKDTVIISLQNGVNAKEIIKENTHGTVPNILEGCIYIASNIEKPGLVNHVGGPGKVFFGNDDKSDFQWVEHLLKKGGIEASYTKNIKDILWKKYLFVSPVAAMTTALNITFGELAEHPGLMNHLEKMMQEVQNVAHEFNVTLTDKDIEDAMKMLSNFPYRAKSSLQLDFENKNDRNEKCYLVDYIIDNGNKFGVPVEAYKKMNERIGRSQ